MKAVLDCRTALDYLLDRQPGSCAVTNTIAAFGWTLLGKSRLSNRSLHNQLAGESDSFERVSLT